ncbi:hypothetical protein C4D60_Mb08t19550 [Musa balbisiana]|uniref:Phytocyanin domain-containing protein n=1 Tax=Musa balbisiana TaxID=52838 RepID=A0A4V4H921_MUSBA|nr:hypothetical protein C4D60_Mb08t19550 [Musa balbisiana]
MAMAAALVVFLLASGVGRSESAVFKVGDAVGWTILGSPNYTAWSLSKNFKMGDTIVFEYSKNIHNVLEFVRDKRVDIQVSKPSSAAPAYPPSRVGSSGGSSGGVSTPAAAAPRSSSGPRCVAKVFVIGLAMLSSAAVCVCVSSGRSTATPPVEVAVMVPATEGSGMVRRRADAPLRRQRPRRSRLRCRRRRRMAPLPPHGVAAGNQGMTHASLPGAVHEKEKERE